MRRILLSAASLAQLVLLSGCLKGVLPDPEAEAKKIEDEAAATGAACRQAGRSLEDCFMRNEALNRNGALRGWREMDDYMRSNKLDPQPPTKEMVDKEAALKDASKDGKEPSKEAPKEGQDGQAKASGSH